MVLLNRVMQRCETRGINSIYDHTVLNERLENSLVTIDRSVLKRRMSLVI